jgi:hypothetical protein
MDVSEPSCSWFLQACVTQCFPEVMVMLWLTEKISLINAMFHF